MGGRDGNRACIRHDGKIVYMRLGPMVPDMRDGWFLVAQLTTFSRSTVIGNPWLLLGVVAGHARALGVSLRSTQPRSDTLGDHPLV